MGKLVAGFIGLGNMGFPMATNLLKSGFKLYIHDINRNVVDKLSGYDIVFCESPKEVADSVETILVSLPTPEIVKGVACGENGIIQGSKVKLYIDLSSSGKVASEEVNDLLTAKGVKVLDAPVSGGVIGAENATLSLMVAGDKEKYDEAQFIFNTIGKKNFYVGEKVGSAQVMKVINNLLSSAALALTSEAIVLGTKAGLNPSKMIEVLNASSGRNSATEDKFEKSILNRNFDYGFKATLAYKDMKLCLDLANELDVPMFLGSNIVNFWKFVVSQGYLNGEPDQDYTKAITYIEDWAGVKVHSDANKVIHS